MGSSPLLNGKRQLAKSGSCSSESLGSSFQFKMLFAVFSTDEVGCAGSTLKGLDNEHRCTRQSTLASSIADIQSKEYTGLCTLGPVLASTVLPRYFQVLQYRHQGSCLTQLILLCGSLQLVKVMTACRFWKTCLAAPLCSSGNDSAGMGRRSYQE